MTEQEYDEQIAPLLAEVAEKIGALGGSIVARVEWAPNEAGTTILGVTDQSGISQKLARAGALCNGNLDALYIHCARNHDLSATMVGRRMGWEPTLDTDRKQT